MTNSSIGGIRRKPKLHRPDPPKEIVSGKEAQPFKLYPHACGRWCCRSLDRFYYFERWGERRDGEMMPLPKDGKYPAGAVESHRQYIANKASILAGQPLDAPETDDGPCTLRRLCNAFLTDKTALAKTGEIKMRTLFDYKQTCDLLIKEFGKTKIVAELEPMDFSRLRASLNVGPVRLGNIIARIRSVFRWGDEN